MPRCATNPSVAPVSHVKHPGNSFYQYVNEAWLKKAHISPWLSEYGVSDEMEKETDKQLYKILDSLPQSVSLSTLPKTSEDQLRLVSNIWKNRSIENEESYIKICLDQLMASSGSYEMGVFFGWLCRSRISTIVEIVAQEEIVPPYFVRASLTPGALTLPLKYYLHPEYKKSDVWKAYVRYIATCSVELNLPYLLNAIDAECELAKHLDSSFVTLAKNSKGRKLKRWVPEFEWDGFMEGLNIDEHWHTRMWLLDAPERLKSVLKWICTATPQQVVAVFALHLLTFSSPYLRSSIRESANTLFQTALRGVSTDLPEKEQFLADMKMILPDALCSVYAKRQHDPKKIENIKDLVQKLQGAAGDVMRDTSVFSKRTSSATQEKIRRMRFEIGKGDDAPLHVTGYNLDSLLHTVISIQRARTLQIIGLSGKPSNSKDSSYPCFVSNASYYSESNHIVIPLGILQWPFFCKDAPLGWNYGGIGATISHEMTHGFDLEGSLYTPRAIYKEWWTRKNRDKFRKQTRKVSKFFGKFKHYGIPLNGERTLSENWADLGGIYISLRGLKEVLDSMGADDLTRKEAHRNFFIAYAVSWRTLVRKEKMVYAILTSVHAPADDRVDRIVPQFQEWVDAFDIKETDALFVPRGERLKFF